MRYIAIALAVVLSGLLQAQTLKISAQVMARADDGTIIPGEYVYPEVVLASGETGNLQIGAIIRYPVWTEKVEGDGGVTRRELVYEEAPTGLELSIYHEMKDGVITYCGKAKSTVTQGTLDGVTVSRSVDVVFHGETMLGEVVQATYLGPEGTEEEILLHFGLAE